MARIDTPLTPLVIRFENGDEKVVAHCFPHPLGMLYLDLFWHQNTPKQAAHLLKGSVDGEGPWKIGTAIIRTLGCQNSDPDLYPQYLPWKEYLESHSDEYPAKEQIREIAAKLGASPFTE